MPKRDPMAALDNLCTECGMALRHAGEYHPYAFCAMKKAGLEPWFEVRKMAGQLNLGDPGEVPPLVVEVFPRG